MIYTASSLKCLERVYVAAPYSHPDAGIREKRCRAVTALAGRLMVKGFKVFSPVTHSHPLAAVCPDDPLFWKNWYMTFLEHWATLLMVYQLPGWEESQGVSTEIAWAEKNNLPILYFSRRHANEL